MKKFPRADEPNFTPSVPGYSAMRTFSVYISGERTTIGSATSEQFQTLINEILAPLTFARQYQISAIITDLDWHEYSDR